MQNHQHGTIRVHSLLSYDSIDERDIAVVIPLESDFRRAQQASEHRPFILLHAHVNRSGGKRRKSRLNAKEATHDHRH